MRARGLGAHMPVWTKRPDKVHGFLVCRGHLGSVSSDPPLFPAQETRRAEDRVEMDDLRGELQALRKVLGHVHQVWEEKKSPSKMAQFAFPWD